MLSHAQGISVAFRLVACVIIGALPVAVPVEVAVSAQGSQQIVLPKPVLEKRVPTITRKSAPEHTGNAEPTAALQDGVDVTTSHLVHQYRNAAHPKGKFVPPENTSHGAWWEGFLSGMTARVLISPSPECVILCYSRRDGGGCQVARITAPEAKVALLEPDTSNATTDQDDRLPPALPWGLPVAFPDESPLDHVQVERMAADRFVVCFDRLSTGNASNAGCHLGVVRGLGQGGGNLTLRPFAPALDIGLGRLVSVSPVRADRFAACTRPGTGTTASDDSAGRGEVAVTCRYAEVYENDHDKELGLRWTDEEAIPITWKTGAPTVQRGDATQNSSMTGQNVTSDIRSEPTAQEATDTPYALPFESAKSVDGASSDVNATSSSLPG